jgi:hypothetical protein
VAINVPNACAAEAVAGSLAPPLTNATAAAARFTAVDVQEAPAGMTVVQNNMELKEDDLIDTHIRMCHYTSKCTVTLRLISIQPMCHGVSQWFARALDG